MYRLQNQTNNKTKTEIKRINKLKFAKKELFKIIESIIKA